VSFHWRIADTSRHRGRVSKITPPPCIASVFGNSPGEIFGKRFWGREGYFHFPERRRFKGPTELNTAAKMMDLASFFFSPFKRDAAMLCGFFEAPPQTLGKDLG
jgi:hypothetical protein